MLFAFWLLFVVVASAATGYAIAAEIHQRRAKRCLCDAAEALERELKAYEKARRQLEIETRRYGLPSGPHR